MNQTELHNKLLSIANQLTKLAAALAPEVKSITPKRTQAEALELKEKGICLACGHPIEEGTKHVRGCHETCRKHVLDTYPSEELAMADGVLLPSEKGGRKKSKIRLELESQAQGGITKKQQNAQSKGVKQPRSNP
jgi:hypothetical protein